MAGKIDYGRMMHRAMQGVIADVLREVAVDGLPGAHHFFITFDTRADGVEIADWLHERYPEEMTIVLQNWFEGLEVDSDGFAVTLNFGNAPEHLKVPFDAVRTFVDPSVEFGLRFETQEEVDAAAAEEDADSVPDAPTEMDAREAPQSGADVVSLDKWRK